jgi:flagellin
MSVINTNIKALNAQASAANVDRKLTTSMERLSTGLRINSAKDDAAGLAISNRMTSQIRGYAVAIRNSNDGISMAQTAEGALGQVTDMLQRMRELAVQAGNGAMSAADRQSLQLEVDQMKQQINNVADQTNHNNIKLLDGSAGSVTLQTGVRSGDTMKIGFDSVQTKDIGFGPKASLSSVGSTVYAASPTGEQVGALANGDLTLNGVVVSASLATDDVLSKNGNAASAIAKAAAINRVADQSGVYASVGQTVVYGKEMTAPAGAEAGKITINGVDTAPVTLGSDLEMNRTMIAAAINDISAQTGVVATNTHDDKQGLVLTAKDGRNITIALETGAGKLVESDVGLAAANTYVGSFDLSTKDGSPFTVGTATNGRVLNAGLSTGTFKDNQAQAVSLNRASAGAGVIPGAAGSTGVLSGNTLVLNGVGIDAAIGSDDDASSTWATSSTKAASAIAIAAAINKKSDQTGVRAVAEANVIRGTGFDPSGGAVTDLNINGVAIDINIDAKSNRDDVIKAINNYQGQTGVVASAWGAGLQLTAADGRNISIGSTTATAAASLGLKDVAIGTGNAAGDLVTFYSNVRLESDKQFTVASGNEGNDTNFALLGFRRGTFGGANNGVKVADVDISTQAGASTAINAIDAAIESVSAMQAKAGAFQNRLEAVVSNLTESNQNMSASRSRIQDTDYATETTSLAKSQIISQAATAMLAQANQSAQNVLSLLK